MTPAHQFLIETDCIPCDGTGGMETANGNNPQAFLIRCNGCEGRGVVWVCPHCGDVPEINQGKGYEIAAGKRRYRAIGLAIQAGKLMADFPIPVKIQTLTDLELVELATTENSARDDMHPLDEAQAFTTMLGLGSDPESIALKIGINLKTVQQRLSLAQDFGASAKKALFKGEINLSQAQALTMGNVKTQNTILKEMKHSYRRWTARDIHSFFSSELMPVVNGIFDTSLYKGQITNNLFDPEHEPAFVNSELARRLQFEAIDQKREVYEQTWAWVEVIERRYYQSWNYQSPKKTDPNTQGVIISYDSDTMQVEVHEGLTLKKKKKPRKATKTPKTSNPKTPIPRSS